MKAILDKQATVCFNGFMTSTTTAPPAIVAQRVIETARSAGNRLEVTFRIAVRRDLAEVSCSFTPGDVAQYRDVETAAYEILRHLRQTRPGSIWGSTSDGVGGHAAIKDGQFHLCKSGVSQRELDALAKALKAGAR